MTDLGLCEVFTVGLVMPSGIVLIVVSLTVKRITSR